MKKNLVVCLFLIGGTAAQVTNGGNGDDVKKDSNKSATIGEEKMSDYDGSEPLILTPLLISGKQEEARKLAEVDEEELCGSK